MLREGNIPLSSLADIHYGKSPNAVRNPRGHVPVIGTGGVTGRAIASLFDGPAVVVGRKGTLDKPFYINEPFWPIDTTYAVIPKKDVDPKWLYYGLCITDLKKLNEATGVPSINRDFLSRVEFFTPKEPEQRAVARVLDTVDEAMEATSAMLAKQEKIKQGLLQDLLTRGVDEKGHLRPTYAEAPNLYHHTPLGWLPKGWEAVPLKKAADIIISNVDKKTRLSDRSVWLCNYMDVYSNRFITNDMAFMRSTASDAEIAKFLLRKGDVIFTKDSETPDDIAVPTVVKEDIDDLVCGYHLAIARPKQDVVGEYLMYALLSESSKRQFGAVATGSTRYGLTIGNIESVLIQKAGTKEQEKICELLAAEHTAKDSLAAELTKLRALKAGLMQDLLTGKKRVTPALMQQIQQQAA